MDTNPTAPLVPYLLLINNFKDSIFVVDSQERVVFMNQAAQLIVEWTGITIANLRFHDLFPNLPALDQLPEKLEPTQFQLERNGQVRFMDVRQTRLSDVESGFIGYIVYLEEITNQKSVERSLNAERNFINTILDTMQALMVVIDRSGRIVRINRACEQFFGYSHLEIFNKRVWDLVQTQDDLVKNEMFANLQAGLNPFLSLNHWVTSEGAQKLIAWSSAMVLNERDSQQYIVAVGIDMTDRVRIEGLLEQERLLLRHLIDSIPDLIFYKDVHGVYQGWNKAFRVFRGTKTDAIKEMVTDADIYPAEKVQQFKDIDREVLSSGQPAIYENWTIDAEGKSVLLETNKTPYFGSDGEVMGVIGVGRDITRHRLLENELRAANLEIEQLIASLSSALIAVTTELKVTRWNPKAETIFGVQVEKAIGQSLNEIGLSWEWENITAAISHCNSEKKAIFMDPVRFKRQDNSEGHLGINISPIFKGDRSLSGFILLFNDITERKQSERRLAQSQKLESIGQLAAGIAHEINTPVQYVDSNMRFLQQSFKELLQVMTSYQEILRVVPTESVSPDLLSDAKALEHIVDLDFLTTEIPDAISQTLDGTQRISEIVQAMKGFSHPGVIKKTPVNLNKALMDTLTVARHTWKYVAEVQTDFAPELPDVICQPGEINQVFLNIIVNAADALSELARVDQSRKGVIRTSTRQDGDWVEVRIADNGPGIPPEIRQRIYEPFFTTKEVGKGTGQGLAIAYDIVEHKHGGSLSFETEVGLGTTFVIKLPINATEGESNG